MILDATCSRLRNWPEHADVRVDISLEALPDVRADAKHLPFADGCFDEVYCDPPHFVSTGTKDRRWREGFVAHQPASFRRFGFFESPAEWRYFLETSGREFYRVLKPGGILHYKLPDGRRSHGRVADYHDLYRLDGFKVETVELVSSDSIQARRNRRLGKAGTTVAYVTLRRARSEPT